MADGVLAGKMKEVGCPTLRGYGFPLRSETKNNGGERD